MSLTLVPTPIGNADDFTIRGIATLKEADVIIVEEFKESTQWLRTQHISNSVLERLNEHSTEKDIQDLTEICRSKKVALITDSGTPGFCDPGSRLVDSCRKNNVQVKALPGASSLMLMLSYSSKRIDQFFFKGFLSPETETRKSELNTLKKYSFPIILMDTPYRMIKTLTELSEVYPNSTILFGVNLTQENELII